MGRLIKTLVVRALSGIRHLAIALCTVHMSLRRVPKFLISEGVLKIAISESVVVELKISEGVRNNLMISKGVTSNSWKFPRGRGKISKGGFLPWNLVNRYFGGCLVNLKNF